MITKFYIYAWICAVLSWISFYYRHPITCGFFVIVAFFWSIADINNPPNGNDKIDLDSDGPKAA